MGVRFIGQEEPLGPVGLDKLLNSPRREMVGVLVRKQQVFEVGEGRGALLHALQVGFRHLAEGVPVLVVDSVNRQAAAGVLDQASGISDEGALDEGCHGVFSGAMRVCPAPAADR